MCFYCVQDEKIGNLMREREKRRIKKKINKKEEKREKEREKERDRRIENWGKDRERMMKDERYKEMEDLEKSGNLRCLPLFSNLLPQKILNL